MSTRRDAAGFPRTVTHTETVLYSQDPATGQTTSELVDISEQSAVLTTDDTPPTGQPRQVGHLQITPRGKRLTVETPEGRRAAAGPARLETVRYVHDLDTGKETREALGRLPLSRHGVGGNESTARPGTDPVSLVSRLKSLIAANRAAGRGAVGAVAGDRRRAGAVRGGLGRRSSRRQSESARSDQGYEVNMTVRYEDQEKAKPKAPRPRRRLHDELFG